MSGAAKLLEHLPVEHGCLGLAGDLQVRQQNQTDEGRVRLQSHGHF